MRVLYLHGFASSAASTKAAFFAARLREHGIRVETPDLNEPDFSSLTITRMVDQVSVRIGDAREDVVLIGSSMGAFVAVQVAGRVPLSKLVLLAPALEFAARDDIALGDRTLDEWRKTGVTNVFHYGYGRVVPLRYDLYADACGFDCVNADLTMPIIVFQGRRDTIVNPASVERWASARPNVELHLLDDDHQLGASLVYMGRETVRFLGLDGAGPTKNSPT